MLFIFYFYFLSVIFGASSDLFLDSDSDQDEMNNYGVFHEEERFQFEKMEKKRTNMFEEDAEQYSSLLQDHEEMSSVLTRRDDEESWGDACMRRELQVKFECLLHKQDYEKPLGPKYFFNKIRGEINFQ
jgi:hypothetical protein